MRFVPHTEKEQKELLSSVGRSSLPDLFSDVPENVRLKKALTLPSPLSEPELLAELSAASAKNKPSSLFLGGGAYRHFVPSVVKHLVSRSEFYTAYTPYQSETSQGALRAIFEYQSMICALTGMDMANASMYDGASAMAEASLLACRATGRKTIAVSSAAHPEYRSVLKTYANGAGLSIKELPFDQKSGRTKGAEGIGQEVACVILQQPNFFGCIEDPKAFAKAAHSSGGLFIVSVDPVSLGLLSPPGQYGADIVVGEAASLGNPAAFGGPALGLFAAKNEFARQLPGRVVGQTEDAKGRRGFCLTLQTREQHIRRERATSNICSNEALAALAATVYLATMGRSGMKKVAELCLQKSNYLKKRFAKQAAFSAPTFKEFAVKSKAAAGLSLERFYPELKDHRLVCVTELLKKSDLDAVNL